MTVGEQAFVLLGGGVDAVDIVERVSRMGYRTVVIDRDEDAPAKPEAAEFLCASCYHEAPVLAALEDWAKKTKERPAAVMCAGVDAPHVAAAVAERWGLVGPSRRTAALSRDKYRQKEVLRRVWVRVPWYDSTRKLDVDAVDHLREDGWDLVVKPVDSRGGRGVIRLLPTVDTSWALGEAQAHSSVGEAIIERWITGAQVSAESIISGGRLLWTSLAERNYARLDEFAPYVIEDGSDMPLSDALDNCETLAAGRVNEQMQAAADAIGLLDGTLKGDVVLNGSMVTVIEVAARLSGGSFCSVMTPLCWGVDVVGLAARIALGERLTTADVRPWFARHVCQRFAFPRRPTCHPERGGHIIATGMSREEARANAAALLGGA